MAGADAFSARVPGHPELALVGAEPLQRVVVDHSVGFVPPAAQLGLRVVVPRQLACDALKGWAVVRELAPVALAPEHCMEEADGERPFLQNAHEREALLHTLHRPLCTYRCHFDPVVAPRAHEHLCLAPGHPVGVLHLVQATVACAVPPVDEPRQYPLLGLAEDPDEVPVGVVHVVARRFLGDHGLVCAPERAPQRLRAAPVLRYPLRAV
mmetsp:Transcript_101817/g.288300  ORF Transcript_101817/g.288300 Transcript_101817/m.288300 type:complete len:210 (+) Transcript_101817:158-787(+)